MRALGFESSDLGEVSKEFRILQAQLPGTLPEHTSAQHPSRIAQVRNSHRTAQLLLFSLLLSEPLSAACTMEGMMARELYAALLCGYFILLN